MTNTAHLIPPDRDLPWPELVAADADALERELRGHLAALRAAGPRWQARTTVETASARHASGRIVLSEREIAIVLRVLLPTALTTRRRHGAAAHTTMHAAIAGFLDAARRLTTRDATLFTAARLAGVTLSEAARAWVAAIGWQLACIRAHVRWPVDRIGKASVINTVLEQQAPRTRNKRGTRAVAGQQTLLLPITGAPGRACGSAEHSKARQGGACGSAASQDSAGQADGKTDRVA